MLFLDEINWGGFYMNENQVKVHKLCNEISNYKPFIQGITVSGGECTLQEEFLIELFTKAKSIGLSSEEIREIIDIMLEE